MATDIEQSPLFDYASLDGTTRAFVQEKAQAIHARLKRTAEDIIAIGRDLIEVKARLGHGEFIPWLRSEFDMSIDSAQDFMRVARRFENKNWNFQHLTISVLYELASPSMPENVIEMVESGQIPSTLPAIREAKKEYQEPIQEHPSLLQSVLPEPNYSPSTSTYELSRIQVFDAVDAGILDVEVEDEEEEEKNIVYSPPTEIASKEKRDEHVMRVMGSSDSPEWYTPDFVIEHTLRLFGEIDLDPCSNSHEAPNVPARNIYTKDDDGLSQIWEGKVYLNPPYGSEIGKWINKLVASYTNGSVTESLSLLPARIDTAWFQPLYDFLMCNMRGRVQFANASNSAPFPSVIVYMGNRNDEFIEQFRALGPIMKRIG